MPLVWHLLHVHWSEALGTYNEEHLRATIFRIQKDDLEINNTYF